MRARVYRTPLPAETDQVCLVEGEELVTCVEVPRGLFPLAVATLRRDDDGHLYAPFEVRDVG